MDNDLLNAVKLDEIFTVELTRAEARYLCDMTDHENLAEALDEAQGAADAPGKTTFLVIKIKGSNL